MDAYANLSMFALCLATTTVTIHERATLICRHMVGIGRGSHQSARSILWTDRLALAITPA